jgi:hypothetical protein
MATREPFRVPEVTCGLLHSCGYIVSIVMSNLKLEVQHDEW